VLALPELPLGATESRASSYNPSTLKQILYEIVIYEGDSLRIVAGFALGIQFGVRVSSSGMTD